MNINKLISKFILNKDEQEERDALELWKEESANNLNALRQSLDINKASEELTDYQKVDKKAAWQKVERRIEKKVPVIGFSVYKRIAAIFLLALGSIFVYNYFTVKTTFDAKTYTYTEIRDINLNDGSSITLDKNSKLIEKESRNVTLDGRAYFKIAPDKTNPFTIELMHGKVTVLGTEFNINTSTVKSEIYLTEGKVKYEYNGKSYLMSGGDMIYIMNDKVHLVAQPKISPAKWMIKPLKFENQSLHDVMITLAAYYNMEVVFDENDKSDKCKINTSFTNENLDQTLREISLLSGMKYEITKNKIIIKTYKC